MMNELGIRNAAESFLHQSSSSSSPVSSNEKHPFLVCIELSSDGGYREVTDISNLIGTTDHFLVDSVVQKDSCAAVTVQSTTTEKDNDGGDEKTGIITMLWMGGEWTIVSVVISHYGGCRNEPIDPSSFAAVASACWDGYCDSNRQCDGHRMAQVFHPLCRLVFVKDGTGDDDDDDNNNKDNPPQTVVSIPQQEFCSMVSNRYSLPLHQRYAHLQDDPRAWQGNTLLGVIFASPQLALVTLKVGHPPYLWTDVLTLARLLQEEETNHTIQNGGSSTNHRPMNRSWPTKRNKKNERMK